MTALLLIVDAVAAECRSAIAFVAADVRRPRLRFALSGRAKE